jgi:stress response protein YsnF
MAIAPLSQLKDYKLVNSKQDVRGWEVKDSAGHDLGKVNEMIVDTDREQVTELKLDSGRDVPVREVTLGDHVVLLGTADTADAGARGRAEVRLEVVEEQFRVSKREVEQGGIRVSSHTKERPVQEQVRLREEKVEVAHRKVDRPIPDAQVQALRDTTVEVLENAEVPVVSKQARVVEEVVVRKDVVERAETVRDTVRRTDVEVEPIEQGRSQRRESAPR